MCDVREVQQISVQSVLLVLRRPHPLPFYTANQHRAADLLFDKVFFYFFFFIFNFMMIKRIFTAVDI